MYVLSTFIFHQLFIFQFQFVCILNFLGIYCTWSYISLFFFNVFSVQWKHIPRCQSSTLRVYRWVWATVDSNSSHLCQISISWPLPKINAGHPIQTACLINSSPPSAAYMHPWIGSELVQIMACRLFGAKPLSEAMLGLLLTWPVGTNFREILAVWYKTIFGSQNFGYQIRWPFGTGYQNW